MRSVLKVDGIVFVRYGTGSLRAPPGALSVCLRPPDKHGVPSQIAWELPVLTKFARSPHNRRCHNFMSFPRDERRSPTARLQDVGTYFPGQFRRLMPHHFE